jgi:4-hydroxybenzoate polyprenyltransferase
LYYKNFEAVIYFHALFLFLLILIRELVKDLENQIGDLANGYKTIPLTYSENLSKNIIVILSIITIIPVYFLIAVFDVGYMDIYFYVAFMILIYLDLRLFQSNSKEHYLQLHNLLKFTILAGIFCIVLINPSVLLHFKNLIL